MANVHPSPPSGFCGVCLRQIERKPSAKGGRPPMYCSQECRKIFWLMSSLQTQLSALNARGTTLNDEDPLVHHEALRQLRSSIWNVGNVLRPGRGRRAGTTFWFLALDCGHHVEVKARRRQVDGASRLDPVPMATRCESCGMRRAVLASNLKTAPGPETVLWRK